MTAIEQANRLLKVDTPLGADAVLLHEMRITERISEPFSMELELLSTEPSLDFTKIVGKEVTVRVRTEADDRFFHGRVASFSQGGGFGEFHCYRAEVVPWFWMLEKDADCRIFQEMSVPDIIKKVFGDYGFANYKLELEGSYDPKVYCVQYRETDFDFVSRLMEEEGIYYYFEHADGSHTMILGDAPGASKACPGKETIRYNAQGAAVLDESVIDTITIAQHVVSSKARQTDYNFETPKADLGSEREESGADPTLEIYDHPGRHPDKGAGDRLAKIRLEEYRASEKVLSGASRCRPLSAGFHFKLKDHPRKDLNKKYVLTEVIHEAREQAGYHAGAAPADTTYTNVFAAIPYDTPFRPPSKTRKPRIHGTQTAVVVGPAGEEIYTDKYGRIKVQFTWDRLGKKDENSSCWIRVMQSWAGKNWGAFFLPRIGQEVIVDFLEGDPDRPIVSGRVYNAEQMPPYGLPGGKTRSTIKTRSSKGGSPANFNEIRFEDKKGGKEDYIHAEKDHNQITENDRSEDVGHDRSLKVGNDKSEEVGHDRSLQVGNDKTEDVTNDKTVNVHNNLTETVDSNETLTVVKDRTRTVTGNETVTVAKIRVHNVGINEMINVGAAQEFTVGGYRALTIGLHQDTTIALSHNESVGKDHSLDIGKNRTTNVGENDSLKVGKKLVIDAGDEITIKTGKASIVMKKDGTITIKGKDIKIQGSGKIDVKASKNVTIKGKKVLEN